MVAHHAVSGGFVTYHLFVIIVIFENVAGSGAACVAVLLCKHYTTIPLPPRPNNVCRVI